MEKPITSTETPQTTPIDTSNKENTSVPESNDEGLLDFSSMFKKDGFVKRPMPKLGENRKSQASEPNWLLEIPAKHEITLKDLEERRYINEEKWKMMGKTSEGNNESIMALINCLNYLIKSNEMKTETLTLSGVKEKVLGQNMIDGSKTRRETVLECFEIISKTYNIEGVSTRVHEMKEQRQNKEFLKYVIESQSSKSKAFLYICYGQVLCPIGFENTPLVPLDAYKKLCDIKPESMEMWIIFGSGLKSSAPMVIKRWSDVEKEMTSRWPEYLDLNKAKQGRQTWEKVNEEKVDAKMKEVSCWVEFSLSE